MGLRVGLAAGFTDDTTLSESLIKGLAEFEALFFLRLRCRFPALGFLRDEVGHLARRAGHALHWLTTDFMSQAALKSI